jgi:hypothetical protein
VLTNTVVVHLQRTSPELDSERCGVVEAGQSFTAVDSVILDDGKVRLRSSSGGWLTLKSTDMKQFDVC